MKPETIHGRGLPGKRHIPLALPVCAPFFCLPVRCFIFKPDGIGDFVLATGCIRTLAHAYGEENLIICVRPLLASMAKAQFPKAEILALHQAGKRRILNLFVVNALHALPVWATLRRRSVDLAICYRHMRNYLQTFLFLSARAKRYLLCENLLARNKKRSRRFAETLSRWMRSPEELGYPDAAGVPTEIAANRSLTELALGRELAAEEYLPSLIAQPSRSDSPWVCCPVSSAESKDYPAEGWAAAFRLLEQERGVRPLLLTGSEDQRGALEQLAAALAQADCGGVSVAIPSDLPAFAALLASASCVFSVDTAAAHIATALNRPCVVAFSGLHTGMFAPWSTSHLQRWILPEPLPEGQPKNRWSRRLHPDALASAAREILTLAENR